MSKPWKVQPTMPTIILKQGMEVLFFHVGREEVYSGYIHDFDMTMVRYEIHYKTEYGVMKHYASNSNIIAYCNN